jgi:hypothetical protein
MRAKLKNNILINFFPKNPIEKVSYGAQAGIRTRVLRATAAYTGPNYTTWAFKRRNNTDFLY